MKNLRQQAFKKRYNLSTVLMDTARTEPSHKFLTNPTALLTYTYLVHYIREVADSHFPIGRKLRILDWGCGKGQITFLLNEIFADRPVEIVSCDVAGELAKGDSTFGQHTPIIKSNNIKVVPLIHESLLPFEDQSFDIVLSVGVLEHVPNDGDSLQELNRICVGGGLLFCYFLPYTYSWTQKIAHLRGNLYHDRLYDYVKVDTLLKNSNFILLDVWHRSILPKNNIRYPAYRIFESIDQFICEHTFLKVIATNIEFLATKPK